MGENANGHPPVSAKDMDEFISLVTHEIRGPAALIRGYIGLFQQTWREKLDVRQKDYLEKISLANDRMIALSDSFSAMFRADFGEVSIVPESMDLTRLVDSAVSQCQPQIAAKRLRVEKAYDEGVPMVSVDAALTALAIETLFSNAIKYTSDGGMIKLEIGKRGAEIVITISDTGLGIPRDQQDMIFNRFFRASNVRHVNGVGAGLHVARAMLERAGCRIWFASEENKGSSFSMAIPLTGMKERGA